MKVGKFGGSSVANTEQIKKVEDIVNSPDGIKFVVVSAPGTDETREDKITDILYNLFAITHPDVKIETKFNRIDKDYGELLGILKDAYLGISNGLGLDDNVYNECMAKLERVLKDPHSTPHDAGALGEEFNARLIALYLGAEFVDAADLIYNHEGSIDGDNTTTMHRIGELREREGKIVIPGYYGTASLSEKQIRTFSRGGSDLTGALVAAGVGATVYENWTNTDGILCCDPEVIEEDKKKSLKLEILVIQKQENLLTWVLQYSVMKLLVLSKE